MSSEEKFLKKTMKLTWEDRLFHVNWRVRSEANIDLASFCNSITDPKANIDVQLKALDALIAYLRAANAHAGRFFGKQVCDAIVDSKCLVRRRQTVKKAQEVLLLWVELGAVDAFLDAMEKAIKNKGSKKEGPAIDVMIQALRAEQVKEPGHETISVVMGPGPAKVYVPDVALYSNVMERSEQLNLTKTEKELQKKDDELGDAAQTIRNLKFEIEKLKNEKSSTDKTNNDLRKLLEDERKSCKDVEKTVIDASTEVEGLKFQVKDLEYKVTQLKYEKVTLQGEVDYLKSNVIEASVGFPVDFVTCLFEAISQAKVKAP